MVSGSAALSFDEASVITVTLTEEQVQVTPDPGTNLQQRRVKLILIGGNDIQEESTRVDGQGKERTAQRPGKLAKNISQEASYQAGWHVADENTLKRVAIWPQHVETLTVEIKGKECAASIVYGLSKNARLFVMRDYGFSTGPVRYLQRVPGERRQVCDFFQWVSDGELAHHERVGRVSVA
jgi:hypothetical protein